MYCKRNWLAEHCTPFIFRQPFHLYRDPNLTTVRSWYSAGILWELWPKNPSLNITDTHEGTTPSCGSDRKEKVTRKRFYLANRPLGSFHQNLPQCDGNHHRQTHKKGWATQHFRPILSPSEMPTHELQRVVVWRRHVEHQTLETIHFFHVIWHLCKTQREKNISSQ